MELLLPNLLKQKDVDGDVVSCLVAYALSKDPPREDLLLQAIEGVPDKEVLLRDDLAQQLAKAVERLRKISESDRAAVAILQKIIRGYEADKQAWPKVRLCAVATAYFFLGKRPEAGAIYNQVLKDEPENPNAMNGVGLLALYETNYPVAITNCRKALSAGNKEALSPLALAYLMSRNPQGMKDLVPSMLSQRGEDMQILNSLIAYALATNPKDKELFFKALEGISDDQILRRQDTPDAIAAGLILFGEAERAKRLLKKKEEQNRGLRG
jgi:tetratricopeptide (TPR) repeat protein